MAKARKLPPDLAESPAELAKALRRLLQETPPTVGGGGLPDHAFTLYDAEWQMVLLALDATEAKTHRKLERLK